MKLTKRMLKMQMQMVMVMMMMMMMMMMMRTTTTTTTTTTKRHEMVADRVTTRWLKDHQVAPVSAVVL